MIGKPKKYILNLAQVKAEDVEQVGAYAVLQTELLKLQIPLPLGFVITAGVFDDFLIANDLVKFIAPRINEIDHTNDKVAAKISYEIQKVIKDGKIPDVLSAPITKAYQGLSSFSEVFVSLRSSPVHEHLDHSKYAKPIFFKNVTSKEAILTVIKTVWAELFSAEALMHRAKVDYEGYVTEAIVVQKMPQAEVSGVVYSVNPTDNNPEIMEIQAVFGLEEGLDSGEMLADSYFCNKEQEQIIEKKIVAQDEMLVRKGKMDAKNPNTVVKLSEAWKRKQKLDDKYITNLIRITKILEQKFQSAVAIGFAVEAGKLQIINIEPYKGKLLTTKPISNKIEQRLEAQKIDQELRNMQNAKSLKKIEDSQPKLEQENSSSDEVNAKIEVDEQQIEVELQPLSKLETVSSGKGKGEDLGLGLLHFVLSEADWENLTGDEVIVLDQFRDSYVPFINKCKGLIIRHMIDEVMLQKISIPVIMGVDNVFSVLHENDIVTMDPTTGNVYLGAGKHADQIKDQAQKIEQETPPQTLAGKINTGLHSVNEIEAEPELEEGEQENVETQEQGKGGADNNENLITGSISAALSAVPEKGASESALHNADEKLAEQIKNTSLQTIASLNTIEEEETNKKDVARAQGLSESEVLNAEKELKIKTNGNFYVKYSPHKKQLNLAEAEGIYTDLGDYYLELDIHPAVLLNEPKTRREVIQVIVKNLQELLTHCESKPLIVRLSSMRREQLIKLTGYEEDLDSEQLMHLELEIISILRNRERLKNIWLSLPASNENSVLSDMKKSITSFGFRRSSTFKLFSTITSVLGVISVKELVSNETDGMIIDIAKINQSIFQEGQQGRLPQSVNDFLTWSVHAINSSANKACLLVPDEGLADDLLKSMIENGLANFIVEDKDLLKLKKTVAALEVKKLEKKKKRGRKKKIIDYGF